MDESKVDLVIKYALAAAAREDDRWSRQLGAIHLLKYVYLADLASAQQNHGRTLTGADWKFHHYGPWSAAVHARIGAVIAALAATECRFESTRYDGDVVRWTLPNPQDAEATFQEADRGLPSVVTSTVRRTVHEFGSDTSALLNFVYATAPMVRAAPGEPLHFNDLPSPAAIRPPPAPELTRKQQKKQKEALSMIQEKAQALLAARRAQQASSQVVPEPRYDEVFERGSQWLDSLGGGEVEPLHGEVSFPPDIWKSPWRDPDGE